MNSFLPIGSVCIVSGMEKVEVMIVGYCYNKNGKLVDYIGVLFPAGLIKKDFLGFNKDQIKEVLFKGYETDAYKKYVNDLEKVINEAIDSDRVLSVEKFYDTIKKIEVDKKKENNNG